MRFSRSWLFPLPVPELCAQGEQRALHSVFVPEASGCLSNYAFSSSALLCQNDHFESSQVVKSH